MALRIAINGFGRIGRSAFRVALGRPETRVVAVNDLADTETLSYLLRNDSVLGKLETAVESREDSLVVGEEAVRVFREQDPGRLPWRELGVDVVLECTGLHTRRAQAAAHLEAGAGRVVVSAPAPGADATIVLGVNQEHFDPSRHRVVSNASCTANCLAPILAVLHRTYGVRRGLVTMIHSYTADQAILDRPHPDVRRGRAASLSLIPTTTYVAPTVATVLPEMEGRLAGLSVRVPTPSVCLADLSVTLEEPAAADAVNGTLRNAAEGPLRGILGFTEEPLVSVDYVGCPLSAVVDGPSTRDAGGELVKILAWHDNEWGYSNRLVELAEFVGRWGG